MGKREGKTTKGYIGTSKEEGDPEQQCAMKVSRELKTRQWIHRWSGPDVFRWNRYSRWVEVECSLQVVVVLVLGEKNIILLLYPFPIPFNKGREVTALTVSILGCDSNYLHQYADLVYFKTLISSTP